MDFDENVEYPSFKVSQVEENIESGKFASNTPYKLGNSQTKSKIEEGKEMQRRVGRG